MSDSQRGVEPSTDRRLVLARLSDALAVAARSTAVLLVDLDDFRMVNAWHGHAVGDRLLTGVPERRVVARTGDDEFVVVCEDTGAHAAHALACVLRDLVAEPFVIDGATVHVTASVGVAAAVPAGRAITATELLRRADTALHAGKSAGRGEVRVHDPALDEEEADGYALAAELPGALAEEALDVEYQAIVDLRTGGLVGLEALTRWRHPERGLVPPSRFVGLAELTGLAAELDRWVLHRALQDMARLRAAGVVPPDAHLAVNLSAANLDDEQLFDSLLAWTALAGLPPQLLVVEVTETAIMREPASAARLLRRVREQGFPVAMDDFGTGYSSLAHLRDLPVSSLKIDRSFVTDIAEQPDALAIVAWIVGLARAVGVSVVAEGVETEEQCALLRRLGCGTAQGWLWGPAVPVTTLLEGRGWAGLATGRCAAGPRRERPEDGPGPRRQRWPVGRVGSVATRFAAAPGDTDADHAGPAGRTGTRSRPHGAGPG